MNKIYAYLLGVLLLLVSCEKDPEVTASYVYVDNEQVSATLYSLNIRCNIKSDVKIHEVRVEYATEEDDLDNYFVDNERMTESGSLYTASLTGLKEDTYYYIRYKVEDSYSNCIRTTVSKHKTVAVTLPKITTTDATNVSFTTATVGGNVTSDGWATVTERGVVYSTSQNPTTADTKLVSGKGTGSFSISISNLNEGTTYYVRAYAINSKGTRYGEQKSFTTKKSVDGHGYVDLGLSVKWATCNIGADSPEDYGDYFAWGETKPKSTYDWSTYKWCQGSDDKITKYCTSSYYGTVDNKTQLDLSDDAARANWGGSWRMPTQDELTELIEKCTWTWTTQNGVKGYKVTSKTNGYSIFLPATCCRDEGSLDYAGTFGYYWLSSLDWVSPRNARCLEFGSSYVDYHYHYRYYGQSVRPVCP